MKRKWASSDIEKISEKVYKNQSLQILQVPTFKVQKYNVQQLNKLQIPPTLESVSESPKATAWVSDLLHSMFNLTDEIKFDDQDEPCTNGNNGVKVLVFLGAMGKEYITSIKEQLEHYVDSMIFISSSLKLDSCDAGHHSDDQQCLQLSTYFELIDPLGGGAYPLDYLVVVDSQDYIRCRIPIRICRNNFHSPHEKFGVDLERLPSLIEEYMQHFMSILAITY